ncbi:MAG: type II toxin-antitoxin system RelE/ParE family toxin [Planctomycetota bacterium]|jgi:plasmid stabilization system protein ParE
MSRITFSKTARTDRRAITEYTVERFGSLQARRLRDRFEATLYVPADSPWIGRTAPHLDPPGHTFRYATILGTFIIVYEPVDDGIRVARLVHGAGEVAAELRRDAGDV